MHQRGLGIPANATSARRLFEKAAEQGYGPAFGSLAMMHLYGADGIPINISRGLAFLEVSTSGPRARKERPDSRCRLLQAGASQGDPDCHLQLGMLHTGALVLPLQQHQAEGAPADAFAFQPDRVKGYVHLEVGGP